MNLKKIFLFIIFIYILTLLESSFFVHFDIFNKIPNLILVLVILINFLEKPKEKVGLWSAGIAGFFLDIFSTPPLGINFIGFYILILLTISIFIKIILRKYVRIPIIKRT